MSAERIAIVGAGGHAREVLEILLVRRASGQDVEPLGFIDAADAGRRNAINGLPVLGGFGWFEGVDPGEVKVICAVGTPVLCARLVERARSLGLRFASAVSPQAWIAPTARVGEGVMIFPGVVVNANACVDDHVTLNVAATVSHDTVVGSFSSVSPGAHLAGNVRLGERCFIGMGANVIQGVTIGPASVIGAGATVLEDVPAGVTAVGTPARVVGPATESPMARD